MVGVNEIGRRSSSVTCAVFFFKIGKTLANFHTGGTLPFQIEALNIDATGEQRVCLKTDKQCHS
jgi:hypothetical protein